MNIEIVWFGDQFNVNLASAPGKEAFLSVKGCRLVDGQKGQFVSYPATKNTTTGKWWSHCWGSDQFNDVVAAKAREAMPKAPSRAKAPPADSDKDVPF